MSDQADSLRKLVRKTLQAHPALQPGVPVVVLSGGQHEAGASTVSLQLAHELAQLGKHAVLVDANLSEPKLTSQLAVARGGGSLGDVLSGSRSVIEVLTPISDRVSLLPGRWDPSAPPELHRVALQRFLGEVRALHSHADVVIVDVGDGMSPWVQQMWQAAQQILLVTTTEPAAVTESYATIKLAPWGDVDGKLRLVVHGVQDITEADRVGMNFAATCRQFLGIKIGPHATLTKSIEGDPAGARVGSDDRAFTQSVRLLAADLMSNCLVLATRTSRRGDRSAASLPDTRGKFVSKHKIDSRFPGGGDDED